MNFSTDTIRRSLSIAKVALRFAFVWIAMFNSWGCSSFYIAIDRRTRANHYRAQLSRISFPTTRAELEAALPPIDLPKLRTISGILILGLEMHALDADFSVLFNVDYEKWPAGMARSSGVRSRFARPVTSADARMLRNRAARLHRRPADRILWAEIWRKEERPLHARR